MSLQNATSSSAYSLVLLFSVVLFVNENFPIKPDFVKIKGVKNSTLSDKKLKIDLRKFVMNLYVASD